MPDKYLGEEHVPPSIGGDGRLSDEDRKIFEAMLWRQGNFAGRGIGAANVKKAEAQRLQRQREMEELEEFREAVKARGAKEGPRPLNEAQKRRAKIIEEAEKARGPGLKKAEPKLKLPKHWRNKPFI